MFACHKCKLNKYKLNAHFYCADLCISVCINTNMSSVCVFFLYIYKPYMFYTYIKSTTYI